MTQGRQETSSGTPEVASPRQPQDRYDTQTLFGGRREILVQHGDQLYRLRITRQGKLILTK